VSMDVGFWPLIGVCLVYLLGNLAQVAFAAHLLLMRNAQQAACGGYAGSGALNDCHASEGS
jgi:hypothetical protein